jgi:hypothetical protein
MVLLYANVGVRKSVKCAEIDQVQSVSLGKVALDESSKMLTPRRSGEIPLKGLAFPSECLSTFWVLWVFLAATKVNFVHDKALAIYARPPYFM